MSLLKTNEIQNYNGSSLTLTASTVSTSAQLNTGGNISVTGSLNVSDDSTTRTNLGLGTISTQDSDSITVTGGSVTGTEIDLKSSGTTIYKSNGTTAVLSESGGVVTLNNVTLGSSVSGVGQLVGVSYVNSMSGDGNYVTVENNKDYILFVSGYGVAGSDAYGLTEYYEFSVDGSGTVTGTEQVSLVGSISLNATTNAVRVTSSNADQGYFAGLVFEQGSTFDAS